MYNNISSLAYVRYYSGFSIPAFVRNYITGTVMLQVEDNTRLMEVTLAGVNWLLPH